MYIGTVPRKMTILMAVEFRYRSYVSYRITFIVNILYIQLYSLSFFYLIKKKLLKFMRPNQGQKKTGLKRQAHTQQMMSTIACTRFKCADYIFFEICALTIVHDTDSNLRLRQILIIYFLKAGKQVACFNAGKQVSNNISLMQSSTTETSTVIFAKIFP